MSPLDSDLAVGNPFPGLRPFEAEETHLFFGRDAQVHELLRRLRRTRFLAVVGSSGSGKSSLVRAGLLPALRGGLMVPPGSAWRIAVLRPGDDPMRRLADALVASGIRPPGTDDAELGRSVVETTLRRSSLGLVQAAREARLDGAEAVLVLVDQFEEIFRVAQQIHRDGGGGAAAFVRLLLEATAQPDLPIYVVLTMRSDYLGDCAAFRDLPEAINDGQYLIPRLTRDQLRDAIEGPIKVGQAEATPRLIQRLLNDVGDSPDQLPILQHALMRTWDRWSHEGAQGPLDLSHYEAIGTMAEALSRHSEEAWDELGGREGSPSRLQDIARQLFQRISEKGLDNRETRRPAPLREVAAVAGAEEREVVAVVETYRTGGRTFLVPPAPEPLTGDSIIDISHEALIRLWGRLAGWVDEEARSAATYRRLAADAARYRAGEVSLWRDPELTNALKWRERARPTAAWAARYDPTFAEAMAFLDDSRRAQRRARWGRFGLWGALPIALALLGLLGYSLRTQRQLSIQSALAIDNARKAEEQRRIAEGREKEAQGLKVEAVANAEAAKDAEGRAQDARKLAERLGREARAGQLAAEGEVVKLDSPSKIELSALLAVESVQASHLPEGDRLLRELVGLLRPRVVTLPVTGDSRFASVSPDGERILAPRPDGTVVLVDGATGRHLADLDRGTFRSFHFSPDSRRIALVEDSGRVGVWDASTGKSIGSLPESTTAGSPEFSKDGAVLLIAARNDGILLWEPARGGQPERFLVPDLEVSADGSLLAWRTATGDIHFRDRKTGNELPVLHHPGVTMMAWSPTGDLLAVVTYNRRLIIVSPGRSKPVWEDDFAGVVRRVVWSPTGRSLAVVAEDNNETDVWMLRPRSNIGMRRLSVPQGAHLVVWSPDETLLAVVEIQNRDTREAVVRIWEVENGNERRRLVHQGAVTSVDFAPTNDGRIATASTDGIARVWQTGIGREVARLPHETAWIWVAFSRGAERLVTTSSVGATIWDVANQRVTVPLIRYDRPSGVPSPARDPAASTPPGSMLTQPRRMEPSLSSRVVYPEGLSPDGARFVSAGARDVYVWDTINGHSRAWPASVTPGDVVPGETVASVAMSANGKIVAAAHGNAIQTWNVASGSPVQRLSTVPRNRYRVPRFALSGDGTRIAWLSDGDDRLFVSGPTTAAPLMTLAVAKNAPFALSPDGRRLAVMGRNFTLRIAVVAPGSVELPAGEGRLPEGPLVFSPEGKTIAWRSADTAISIGRSGNDATRFETGEPETLLRFSGDGSLLVGVNRHDVIHLWAVNPPRLLTRLPPQPGTVRGVAVTPDNRTLVVAVDTFDGVGVVRHPLTATGLAQQACALLHRNLSLDEWKEHLGAEPYRRTCPSLPPASAARGGG
jgi:WD40 repeat protein/energy-coupling factor transporter ATP-binding protein EcfA2